MNHYRRGTAIEWRYTEDGQKIRISLRTGRAIPIPVSNEETIDYKAPKFYHEQAKDTSKAETEKITFMVCNIHLKNATVI